MSTENQKQISFKESLDKTYRLIVQTSETFEEKISLKFKLWHMVLLGVLSLFGLIMLIAATLIYTPLNRLFFEHGEISQYREIYNELDEMERKLKAQQTYTTRFMRMLNDSVETAEDNQKKQIELSETDDSSNISKVKEDSLIRQEIENDEKLMEEALLAVSSSESRILPLEKLYFIPPVTGQISASYMPDKEHYGTDIIAPKNTPIKAVMEGYVISSDWSMETGNTIGIQHANNIISFYKHNSKNLKKTGEAVKAGEAIAIIGNTGEQTNGPHLHFELWHKGKPLNSEEYIQF